MKEIIKKYLDDNPDSDLCDAWGQMVEETLEDGEETYDIEDYLEELEYQRADGNVGSNEYDKARKYLIDNWPEDEEL